MSESTNFMDLFETDINLKALFDIISPENNLVLADDMMLSDAKGIILRVSENYERNFGFSHGSIVGKSAFDLEVDGTFSPCITAEVIRQRHMGKLPGAFLLGAGVERIGRVGDQRAEVVLVA